ncbi:MAG: peptidase M15 [Clostridia bacterium]|nr:peptidase M15 [Clostridia bacterium]
MDINEKVPGAPNFTWRELLRSDTATRLGINNVPPAGSAVWHNLEYVARNVLQPVRDEFGPILVTSGYRGPALNRAVGGSTTSFHLQGNAVDFEPLNNKYSIKDVFEFVYKKLPYTELIAENIPDGWVHAALAKGREREKQLKYKLVGSGVKRGSYEYIMERFV